MNHGLIKGPLEHKTKALHSEDRPSVGFLADDECRSPAGSNSNVDFRLMELCVSQRRLLGDHTLANSDC